MIDTIEFIKRSKVSHGNKYDYSNSHYVGSNKRIAITCPVHGDFSQVACEHMRGSGCKHCARQKCDTATFIDQANKIHNGKYGYSKTNFTHGKDKVIISCRLHGEFEQTARLHLKGQGCSICGGSKRLTTSDFIMKAKVVHGDTYNYSLVEYNNSKAKVKIVCHKHGIFLQTPDTHTNHKQGCPKCAGVGRTTEDFIVDASEKHDNKYDYSNTVFEKYNKKVAINCPIHGEFQQKPFIHLMGSGCQKCSESKGERKIASFLRRSSIAFESQKTFSDCKSDKTGRLLRFDFYLPKYNVCIEYDGEYHYEPWRLYFDKSVANEKFHEMQHRDALKTNYCKDNGIQLLRIPHFEMNQIDKIIGSYLPERDQPCQ